MSMNLYAATHFRSIGSSVHHDTPRLIADDGTIQSVGNLKWADHRVAFESLREGLSSVVAISMEDSRHMINEGWRVTRLPDHRTNRMVYDKHAKEIVMITNGACVHDHTSRENYGKTHGNNQACQFAPSEAIALRAFLDNGKAVIAWTYRAVNPCDLEPINDEKHAREQFEAVMSHRRSARFIGRI